MKRKNFVKNKIIGHISTTGKGYGYIDNEDKSKQSVLIEPGFLGTALNGDMVEVEVKERRTRGSVEKIGIVTRVISRAREEFVGTVKKDGKDFVVIPDNSKIYTNFLIQKTKNQKVNEGQKVLIRLVSWKNSQEKPSAKLLKVIGSKGENEAEMQSIVLEKGFSVDFPEQVIVEADQIEKSKKIGADEISKRRDIRNTLTFTIDPFDAKDFDDAISIRKLSTDESSKFAVKGDLFEIGVHIADVSHYVKEGSALDKEALKRGCSVYLVDRTIPMLPEELSNDVCSLNPHEDKLSFSAIFIMDERARIYDRWFGKTVMNSDHRFTYETAQAVIDNSPEQVVTLSSGTQKKESAEAGMKYRADLVILNNIAKVLKKDKFSKGAIEFEQEEVKFRLDEKGKPVGVFRSERLDTHKLVEEYMLLANREVAKFIHDSIKRKGKKDTGSIYRIHDVPDKERIKSLATFVEALGYNLKTKDGEVTAADLNNLLEQIEDTPHESLIRTATVRSMQKAIYSTKNIGHFGLAFHFYTHFTSPIRRYPDLLVHRVLQKHINNEPFGDRDAMVFEKIAETSTSREIDAAEAERASKKLKQVEYMSVRVGQTFEGSITGVTKWGVYIAEEETKSEGMIKIGELGQDYFIYDEKTYSIMGEKTGKRFTLGDKVRFKVKVADLDRRTLDYELV